MFQKAEEAEKSEIGRSYPMALWGAIMTTQFKTMASQFNCTKGNAYLKKIPKERNWTTENENMYIKTAFALYPPTCDKINDEDEKEIKTNFYKTALEIRERYPKDIEAELLFGSWSKKYAKFSSKKNQMGGIHFIRHLLVRDKKYETHPGVLVFLMHFYAYNPKHYKKGNMLILQKMKKPSEKLYTGALPGLHAAHTFLKVASSSCRGLMYTGIIFRNIGNWNMSLVSTKMRIKVIKPDHIDDFLFCFHRHVKF